MIDEGDSARISEYLGDAPFGWPSRNCSRQYGLSVADPSPPVEPGERKARFPRVTVITTPGPVLVIGRTEFRKATGDAP